MTTEPIEDLEKGGHLGLDIETISPNVPYDEYPDFDDPTDFELLATGMAYRPPDASRARIEKQILWRTGTDAATENEHIQQVADVVESLDPSQIITYNGNRFDIRLLRARSQIVGEHIGDHSTFEQISRALTERDHLDLKDAAWEIYGEYTSLEDVLEAQGLAIRRTRIDEFNHGHDLSYRPPTESPHLTSGDIPEIGEAYLRTIDGDEKLVNAEDTKLMLEDYALGDIEHLLALADVHPF